MQTPCACPVTSLAIAKPPHTEPVIRGVYLWVCGRAVGPPPEGEDVPEWCDFVLDQLLEGGHVPQRPNQLTVLELPPGRAPGPTARAGSPGEKTYGWGVPSERHLRCLRVGWSRYTAWGTAAPFSQYWGVEAEEAKNQRIVWGRHWVASLEEHSLFELKVK